eukprot:621004-Karenia_brevis.AAC.1
MASTHFQAYRIIGTHLKRVIKEIREADTEDEHEDTKDYAGFKFKHEHEETEKPSDGKCWDIEADGCPQCG